MTELLCNYAILRFLPYKDIGEFINVGVVVHCPEIDLFDFRLATESNRRVRQFFPELDRGVYKFALQAIERQLKQLRNIAELFTREGIVGETDINRGLESFRMLLQRRESLLHFAAPGTLLSDPRSAAEELFNRYVKREFAAEPEYYENVMRKQLIRWLKQWGIREQYETDVLVGDPMFHLKLPIVRRVNGNPVRAVKPLDLLRLEPTKVFEHGDLWVQRVRRLRERNHLPREMIFPVRLPTENEALIAATQVLRDLSDVPNVTWLPFQEQDGHLKLALAV